NRSAVGDTLAKENQRGGGGGSWRNLRTGYTDRGPFSCQRGSAISVSRSQSRAERRAHPPIETGLPGGFSFFLHGGFEAPSGGADNRLGRLLAINLSLAYGGSAQRMRPRDHPVDDLIIVDHA